MNSKGIRKAYTETSEGSATRNLVLEWKNGFKRQVEHGFSSFFAKFLGYLMIFQRIVVH